MINRIRDIRREKKLTLADVAARCDPPTTAQTIGRLETGMRTLSLAWMNRIAAALDVEPEHLVRSSGSEAVRIAARLTETGAEPLPAPRDAVPPNELASSGSWTALVVETSVGEYRAGDQVWLRAADSLDNRVLNRDVLVTRTGGRFAFGRLIDRDGTRIALLPHGVGQRQVIIDNPAALSVAEMLIRKL